MASIYDVKPQFQALLRPLVGRLADAGVTANHVTIAAIWLSVAYGGALWLSGGSAILFLGLPFVLLVRMALNAVDGMLAREHEQQTDLGAFLNEGGDVVSDIALLLPLALISPFPVFGVLAVVLLSMLTEFAGIMAQSIGASRRYDGPMGKSDRAAVLGVLGVWIGIGMPYAAVAPLVTGVLVIALMFTISNRMRRALVEARAVTGALIAA